MVFSVREFPCCELVLFFVFFLCELIHHKLGGLGNLLTYRLGNFLLESLFFLVNQCTTDKKGLEMQLHCWCQEVGKTCICTYIQLSNELS